MNDTGLLAALGIVSACVAGLIWVIKRMFNDILPILRQLTRATEKNTSATTAADRYLRQRNGRDTEFHAESLAAIKAIPQTMQSIADNQAEAIVTAVRVKEQHIEHQHVEHETVEMKK